MGNKYHQFPVWSLSLGERFIHFGLKVYLNGGLHKVFISTQFVIEIARELKKTTALHTNFMGFQTPQKGFMSELFKYFTDKLCLSQTKLCYFGGCRFSQCLILLTTLHCSL